MWTDPILGKYPWPFKPSTTFGLFYSNELWKCKIQIAGIIGLLLFIIQLVVVFCNNENRNRKWIKTILDHILHDKLNNDIEHTRITVFKIKYGYLIVISYIYHCFVANFITHYKHGVLISHLKIMPHPFKKYLVMYSRKSQPYESGTSTFFKVAKSPEEVCGIASHSLYIGKPYRVSTSSISNISLKSFKKIEDLPQGNRRLVKSYMTANKINDFNKLKCFHRLSNQIWANPIYDKYEVPWGVIVVDSSTDGGSIFEGIEDDLVSYARIIELSVIHLN